MCTLPKKNTEHTAFQIDVILLGSDFTYISQKKKKKREREKEKTQKAKAKGMNEWSLSTGQCL